MKSIIALDKMKNIFKEQDKLIQDKIATYKRRELKVIKIYDENKYNFLNLPVDENMEIESPKLNLLRKKPVIEHTETKPLIVKKKVAVVFSKKNDKFVTKNRNLEQSYNNAVFRLFIWRDMLKELFDKKPIFGFDFGKPLRSVSLEILDWGSIEWLKNGWIAAHNSYLHMIYRAGIMGIFIIIFFISMLIKMIINFCKTGKILGLLLCGVLVNWCIAANFLLIFELPYTAIPFWSIFGLVLAYSQDSKKVN